MLRTKATFPFLPWDKIQQQWCPGPLESTQPSRTSEAAVSPPTCQIFFTGQTLLTASSISIPPFSFLRELRFCSRRQRAELKCSPSQKPLQCSHMTRFPSVRWRGKISRDSWEGFCSPEVHTTTFLLLFYSGCEVAVSLEGEQLSYDHRTTHKGKGGAAPTADCQVPDLFREKNNPFTFLKHSWFVASNWMQS